MRNPGLSIADIRAEFPILNTTVHGKPLIYFDNAATSQKPAEVIEAWTQYYTTYNSNVHRGVHSLSQQATAAFEDARHKVRAFLNAANTHEIIYTRGCTEAINLVAYTWGEKNIGAGDEIIVSSLEHHSNIVPWQMLCERKGAQLKVIPVLPTGELDMEAYQSLLGEKTRLVAVMHVSNTLGTINPVKEIIRLAHAAGAKVLIDGAQALSHLVVDVQELGCDFYAFSGHKVYAPMGIGGLYGKEALLEEMPPFHGGGEMIKNVTFEKTTYNELPFKFEAGTPNVGGAIALGAAIDFVNRVGMHYIAGREKDLLQYATEQFSHRPNLNIVGTAAEKTSVLSFNMRNVHPFDVGTILDHYGVAVRTGNHCTQPLIDCFNIPGTVRASFAFFNTRDEIDVMMEGLKKAEEMFL